MSHAHCDIRIVTVGLSQWDCHSGIVTIGFAYVDISKFNMMEI